MAYPERNTNTPTFGSKSSSSFALSGRDNDFLLLENGDNLLLENGDKIILESSSWTYQTKN